MSPMTRSSNLLNLISCLSCNRWFWVRLWHTNNAIDAFDSDSLSSGSASNYPWFYRYVCSTHLASFLYDLHMEPPYWRSSSCLCIDCEFLLCHHLNKSWSYPALFLSRTNLFTLAQAHCWADIFFAPAYFLPCIFLTLALLVRWAPIPLLYDLSNLDFDMPDFFEPLTTHDG